MKRRAFLGGILALGVLAGAGLRMPRREEVDALPDLSAYFTHKDAWFLPDYPRSGVQVDSFLESVA